MVKAQALMEKITSSPDNPNPNVLHALSSIFETQESRFMEETGHSSLNISSLNNPRASHNVGRLGNLVRDNDEFFELISSTFLSETRYAVSVQAAAARLLFSCSLTWMYPHVFEETVLENIKGWVMDETAKSAGEDHNRKHESGRKKSSNSEMLTTYSTGLLAVCLCDAKERQDRQVVEDVLTSGLSAKLMRYLRLRALGETSLNQKDAPYTAESKNTTSSNCIRGREDSRSRVRQVSETSHLDAPKIIEEGSLDDQTAEQDHDRRLARGNRGWARSKGKGRVNEGDVENEQGLISPGSGSGLGADGRSLKDRVINRSLELKRLPDPKKGLGRIGGDSLVIEREDNDDCFQECKEYRKTNDEEAAVLVASRTASTVIDAANAVEVSRSSSGMLADSMNSRGTVPEPNEEVEEFFIPDTDSLAKLREKFCIQSLVILGEYVEVLGPVLHEKGVDISLALLQRSSKHKETSKMAVLLPDVLKLICTLAAHRKFAALFVDRGGMQRLLAVPRVSQTFCGLSSCLFTIGSLQGIMERVCALPSDAVQQVVELALQLLECPQDQARKNAALFFSNAFVFKAVLDSFDAQDGPQKSLSILLDAASVRSGVNSAALGLSSSSGSVRNDRSPSEVLTSSEKQIAYHTCVALRQYFGAHLLLLVDSIRPNKSNRSAVRNIQNVRAAYKPLDISNEAMDAVFRLLQKDRKLGPAFVRTRWPAVDKFLASNGHIIMLELCQAPTVDRYLHDLVQYALGVLHIVTLVPYSRKPILNAMLSSDRVGIAVILDAANGAGYPDPEIIHPALNVLVNLVCPPPSISNKPPPITQVQQSASGQTSNGSAMESSVVDRGSLAALGTPSVSSTSQAPAISGLVGDRRISLGAGAGCAGLAAQLEQGYHQAREAVRANNGIKVLLQLLQPRIVTPPSALDCLRALACRVLLGLARDDTIAHILTKLQVLLDEKQRVGKKLSELIRDPGSQTSGNEHSRWQAELAQVAIELIAVVTNSGRASTLAATDAATPTLRRIERAAIAAATPITYHSRELLLLIHEHLQASGLSATADTLLKEGQLNPLPSSAAPSSLVHQSSVQDTPSIQIQWPSGHTPGGFLSDRPKISLQDEALRTKCDLDVASAKKPLSFSSTLNCRSKIQPPSQDWLASSSKISSTSKKSSAPTGPPETPSISAVKPNLDNDMQFKTPIVLPMKRKLTELKDTGVALAGKRLQTREPGLRSPVFPTPNNTSRKGTLLTEANAYCTPSSTAKDHYGRFKLNATLGDNSDDNPSTHVGQMTLSSQFGFPSDPQPINTERVTLDSLVVQYLKHQHRQCPAPITTLPPLSLSHPHVCPEPRRSLDAPSNVTARLCTREFRSRYGGIHGNRRDRQFVYNRFRPWRTYRDGGEDGGGLLTCITFLGDSSQIAAGSHSGELKIFDSSSNNAVESCAGHQYPLTVVQSYYSGGAQLVLSSSAHDVRLWDASSVSAGPSHSFEGCKAARLSNSGTTFAAFSTELSQKEIMLYDVQTCQLDLKLMDTSATSSVRGHGYSLVHFSPSDTMLLWNGVLWDRRGSGPIHRFDQFTDYGGGGFHPAGNEICHRQLWTW
ncbi:hypothetical protein RHSIM_Rhsim07G0173400 [Rhododendron simsii]|uniref:LisH domain-containing protein n=1 Tax=Rhododendron simsii TaxID=118357 RepID=A0A834GR41_RHOSS|nr:hypothetical protein RHSIM_Rhsim07G0173400 [Rhododendron simsii]